MKWVAVAVAITAALAAGRLARRKPKVRAALLFLVAFLPFTEDVDRLSVNLLSHEAYRGDARGFEVTLVDIVALTLWVALPKARYPMPYKRLALAYLAVGAASILWAWEPLYAGFGVWRIVRVTFVGAIVARACQDRRAPPLLLRSLACGLLVQLGYVLFQRYVEGAYQVRGTFAHQNSLGMAANLIAPVLLALLLGRGKQKLLAGAALSAAAVCVVFTLSRGALVMLPVGLGLAYVGSLVRRPTALKMRIGVAALVLGAVIGIKSFDSIVERFLYAPEASAEGRERFEQAAADMLADHPAGVGINNFSHVLDEGGYGEAVGLPEYDRSGIVHQIYWLTAAETGYLGVLAYLGLVVFPIVVGLRWFRRHPGDARGDVILGITAGLMVTALQGVLEWLLRQTVMSHLVWIQTAMLLALVRQLREDERRGIVRTAVRPRP